VTYTYNAENRLITVEPQTPVDNDTKVEFLYDYMGRRVQKNVYTYSSSAWSLTSEKLFVYDGWNMIQELNGSGVVQKSYVYGLDISQSLQGAGGIGGLLAVVDGGETYHYCYDANGNVGQLVKAPDGTISAHYQYDPFGNIIDKSGSYADVNPFRFSTKYHDDETGLVYYGYRYYSPSLGRWINRDPLEELGHITLKELPTLTMWLYENYYDSDFGFPGQYYDSETGLHYNYHRYYDPRTGRYLTPDPIGQLGGINLYVYALNDPTAIFDPFGLFCCKSDGTVETNDACCQNASANEKAGAWAQYAYKNPGKLNADFYMHDKNADVNKPKGYWRCNTFVWDSYRRGAGVSSSKIPKHPGTIWPAYANDIANTNFGTKTMSTVGDTGELEPGDIVAWPNTEDSGHVGIVGCDGSIYSARSDEIDYFNPTWGFNNWYYRIFRRSPIYRRPSF